MSTMKKILFLTLLFVVAACEAKKHKKDGHHKNSHHRKGWLNIKEVSGCNCSVHQICISGPATSSKPTCVNRHFLNEGQRLFRKFHHHKVEEAKFLKERPLPHLRPLLDTPADLPHGLRISVHAKHKHYNDAKPKEEIVRAWKHHSGIKKHEHTCTLSDLDDMRERLTGWFRLLHAVDNRKHPHHHRLHRKHHGHQSVKKELRHHHEGRCRCLKSVMWEMRHLDTNKDHHLSQSELDVIENNGREPCLTPFLLSCDHNRDSRLSRNEWCCCYADVLPPCFEKLRQVHILLKSNSESYVPRCDKEGFFEKEQCSGNSFDTKTCWCVDLNGNEVAGTRSRVKAHCRNIDLLGHKRN
ncbi:testican-1-like [Gigantopelta aegis]|uniref:testican-1-like n=1 Tax=Gigantopelta aegis TaxID=1735272 RepID=UPI001B88B0C2|nr:testican-1-like [Gigantopelta aegis]